jgi:hypothetical protein
MRRILGIICILIAVASGGWIAAVIFFSTSTENLTHIGDVSAREGTTVQFVGGGYKLIGPGQIAIVKPIVLDVDRVLWLLSAVSAFASGVVLLRKSP